jgi:hypothetical protein
LEAGRGLRGDLYELRLPDHLQQAVARRAWRPGLIEAVHPVFRHLGAPAAFVYERLDPHPAPSVDLATRAHLSARGAQTALAALAEHGLATRTRTGWVRGPADPTQVARALGVLDTLAALAARYRAERVAWRARLAAVVPLTLADLLPPPRTSSDAAGNGGVGEWPPLLAQPPPEEPETALELLYRVLGAVPLPT